MNDLKTKKSLSTKGGKALIKKILIQQEYKIQNTKKDLNNQIRY